jgi:tetratricopeptide (TPR) repeat protein
LGRDADLYNFGMGGAVSSAFRFSALPWLFWGLNAEYSMLFLKTQSVTSLNLLDAGLSAGIHLDVLDWLNVRLFGTAGWFYGFMSTSSGSNPFASAGAGVSFKLFPALSFDLGAVYRYFFGLSNDVSVSAGITFTPTAAAQPAQPPVQTQPLPVKPAPVSAQPKPAEPERPKSTGLDIVTKDPIVIFPVFYKYYNDHPLGKVVLHNWESTKAENIAVSFQIKQYMDGPKQCVSPVTLGPGQEAEIALSGLLKNTVLEISEPTLVSATITIDYGMGGKAQKKELTQAVRIYDRNAMTWEDDRRAVAFVTAKDPTVLKFSKNVTAMLKGKASDAVNAKLLAAMGVHEALNLYGLTYSVDPTTPYKETSKNKNVVDFLQFPQQTLEYKAGDCDDLSILYSALLESLGVETAFITTPGHIFMAFSLGIMQEEARVAFSRPDDLIMRGDGAWVPVEVTEREGDFLKAWDTGAKEWRENQAKSQAQFYPMHERWKVYEPVGFSGSVVPFDMPQREAVVKAYTEEVGLFVQREISPRVAALKTEIQKAQDPTRAVNKLGIIYARYGLLDQAEEQFAKLVDKEYTPALVNMGNIFWKRGDPRKALGFYTRAQKKEPNNALIVLNVARVNHELENYGEVKIAFSVVKELDPELAQKYAYLDLRGEEASRALEASQTAGQLLWEEEK